MFSDSGLKEVICKLPEDRILKMFTELDSTLDPESELKLIKEKIDTEISSFGLELPKNNVQKDQVSVKHSLKLSIPIFIGLKYEGEISLGAMNEIPKSLLDLKKLLFK